MSFSRDLMFRLLILSLLLLNLSACNLNSVEPAIVIVPHDMPVQDNAPLPAAQPEAQLIAQNTSQTLATPIPVPAVPPQPFADQLDPVLLLASFYNAVNLRDYARAYGYWESPPNQASFNQFAQGYADTAVVVGIVRLPLREGVAAGSSYASLQTVLISIRNNGSQQVYAGCYVGRRSNVPAGDSPTPDPNWRLYDGRAAAAANLVTPALLAQACVGTPYDDPGYTGQDAYDYLGTPITLLQTYYNAINRYDYQRA